MNQTALGWRRGGLALLALPVLLPLGWLLAAWWQPQAAGWTHLRAHVLPQALFETVVLLLGVTSLSVLLGGTLGWLVGRCRFPGQRWLGWVLLLPAALPTYVLAFAWVGLSEYAAPLPGWLRSTLGWTPPAVHGLAGAIFVLGLAFYPYVYLLARQHASQLPASLDETGRLLGLSRRQRAWRIVVPLLLPALALGGSLAAMETLAEFGAVATLGVSSLTTTVYKAWYGLFNLPLAAQLASLAVLFLLGLAVAEAALRRRQRGAAGGRTLAPVKLSGWRAALATATCLLVLLLALVAPLAQLLWWSWRSGRAALVDSLPAFWSTAALAALAALLLVLLGLAVALLERRQRTDPWLGRWSALATGGYAMPGTLLGVALLLLLTPLEQWTGLTLASGVFALLLAYAARFLRMAHAALAERLVGLRDSVPEAARTLGLKRWQRLRWLYLPTLAGPAGVAWLLVFTELCKELPATLILRPLEWDTLAIRIWSYTSEGLWAEAAAPALLLVALSTVPAALLLRTRGAPP